MMLSKCIVYILALLFMLFNAQCTNKNEHAGKEQHGIGVEETVKIGQKMVFPDSIIVLQGNSLRRTQWAEISNYCPKLVSIVLGDCEKCINKIKHLNKFADLEPFKNVQFVIIIDTSDLNYFRDNFMPKINPNLLLIHDPLNSVLLKNHIPYIGEPHTLLLDQNNNILTMGNPLCSVDAAEIFLDALPE